MSSGFVSGGSLENPTERDDEWRKAQAELEAARKAKADLAAQHDGKSLFEILQENKDKKQAEFEERARYKLHVSLDDDEADYLDSIEEKKRKEEAAVRKDTKEQLDAFKRQQEEVERKALEEEGTDLPEVGDVQWVAPGRKRKKGPETNLLKGVKLRKSRSAAEEKGIATKSDQLDGSGSVRSTKTATAGKSGDGPAAPVRNTTPSRKAISASPPANPLSLGLGYPSSDEDD